MSDLVLSVRDLKTYFYLDEGILKAVDGVSFDVRRGETIGIIGESGCGKSVTAQSVLRIVPPPGKTLSGTIEFHRNGSVENLIEYKPNSDQIRSIRGKEISMIFQEPMTSLSPVHTIGNQIIEAILLHITKDKKEARELAIDMIARVGIPNPQLRVDTYPHQLSGGLRQRAMIAMALSCNPSMLIADEPTTALDVTIQAQILGIIQDLQDQFHMAVMFITHNLGVIAEISEDVAVMYLGKVVEFAKARTIFHKPMMPYTESLMKSIPKVGRKARQRLEAIRGTVPIPLNLPRICGFYDRCNKAMEGVCNKAVPALKEIEEGHFVRCFLYHREEEEE